MDKEYKREGDVLINLLIEKIDKLDAKLDTHMVVEAEKISSLMEVFNTAKHVVWFIKWAAVIVSAGALTWAWIHNHFTIGVK